MSTQITPDARNTDVPLFFAAWQYSQHFLEKAGYTFHENSNGKWFFCHGNHKGRALRSRKSAVLAAERYSVKLERGEL